MTPPENPRKRDWLEPPDWWRRWRPLRWGAGLLVVGVALAWFGPLLMSAPVSAPPPPPVHVPDPADPLPPTLTADAAPAAAVSGVEPMPTDTTGRQAYLAMAPDPVMLMEMKSYSGVDDIHRQLRARGVEPEQQSFHATVPAGVPPRDLDLLRLASYSHLGVRGRLELQFFNDRLYQAEFEPVDVEAYRLALRRSLPALTRHRSGRSELREGHLRVASSLDLALSEVGTALGTRPFVLWQDLRLVQQRDAWDREFAKKAAP